MRCCLRTSPPSRTPRGWPRQRLLHECLRTAIRHGTLAAGTRLAASRALAAELGVARNTVLYAYDQLASEGFGQPDRRGTMVASPLRIAGGVRKPQAASRPRGLSRRRSGCARPAPQASACRAASHPACRRWTNFP
jgi:GntR family transcriptional regulator/MocR family aminotransferase